MDIDIVSIIIGKVEKKTLLGSPTIAMIRY
jgi:hypothetical protein